MKVVAVYCVERVAALVDVIWEGMNRAGPDMT